MAVKLSNKCAERSVEHVEDFSREEQIRANPLVCEPINLLLNLSELELANNGYTQESPLASLMIRFISSHMRKNNKITRRP